MTNQHFRLSHVERKSFTINKAEATYLAGEVAKGRKLRFQSVANRNWVAKIARNQYGVNTDVYVSKNQLLDPAYTIEGSASQGRGIAADKHWFDSIYNVEATVLSRYDARTPRW